MYNALSNSLYTLNLKRVKKQRELILSRVTPIVKFIDTNDRKNCHIRQFKVRIGIMSGLCTEMEEV